MSKLQQPISKVVERMATRISKKGYVHSEKLLNEVQNLSKATDSLATLHASRNPYETQATHDRKVSQAAGKLGQRIDQALAKVNETLHKGSLDITTRIESRANLKPGANDLEIRQVFREKPPSERVAALKAAVDSGDTETLSALFLASAFVTGLAGDVAERFQETHELRSAPNEFNERKEFFDGVSDSLLVIETARKISLEYLNPEEMRRHDAEEKAAADAQAQFANAVSAT